MGEFIGMVSGSCGVHGYAFPGDVKQHAVVLRHSSLTAITPRSFLSTIAVVPSAHQFLCIHRGLHSTLSVYQIKLGSSSAIETPGMPPWVSMAVNSSSKEAVQTYIQLSKRSLRGPWRSDREH